MSNGSVLSDEDMGIRRSDAVVLHTRKQQKMCKVLRKRTITLEYSSMNDARSMTTIRRKIEIEKDTISALKLCCVGGKHPPRTRVCVEVSDPVVCMIGLQYWDRQKQQRENKCHWTSTSELSSDDEAWSNRAKLSDSIEFTVANTLARTQKILAPLGVSSL